MHPDLVETVARHADILQIGARNVQNYALLSAVGGVLLLWGLAAFLRFLRRCPRLTEEDDDGPR